MQRLAADDVVRNLFNELRHQRVERFGIYSICEPVTLQRADDLRFIGQRLVEGTGLHRPDETGNGN